jgi:hypothetical protein
MQSPRANEILDADVKSRLKAFSFDFKSLYDSIKPELALKALSVAMEEKRPDWSMEFKKWIMDLVAFSLRSSCGKFQGQYHQENGVPTGSSLCVQITNMAVYYCMRESVYLDDSLMAYIKTVKRYIDDGNWQWLLRRHGRAIHQLYNSS